MRCGQLIDASAWLALQMAQRRVALVRTSCIGVSRQTAVNPIPEFARAHWRRVAICL